MSLRPEVGSNLFSHLRFDDRTLVLKPIISKDSKLLRTFVVQPTVFAP